METKTKGEFVLIDREGDFWMGNGYYIESANLAKVYQTYEAADNACKRMKKRKFKITTLEDIADENE